MIDSRIRYWTECPKELAHYFVNCRNGIRVLSADIDDFLDNHQTSNYHKFWFCDNTNGVEHAVCIIGFENSDAFDEINKENKEFWNKILCVSDLSLDSFGFKDTYSLCETEAQKKSLYILEKFNNNRSLKLPYITKQTVDILKNAIECLIPLHIRTKSLKYLLARSIYVCNNEIHLSLNNISDKKIRQEKLFDLYIPEEEYINFWVETSWSHKCLLCRKYGGVALNRDKANLFFRDDVVVNDRESSYSQYGIYNCCYTRQVYDDFKDDNRCVVGFYSLEKFNEFADSKDKYLTDNIPNIDFSFCETIDTKYALNAVLELYDNKCYAEYNTMTEEEYQYYYKHINVLFPLYDKLFKLGLHSDEFIEFYEYMCEAISIINHTVVMKPHLFGEKIGIIQRRYRDISDDMED